VRRAAKLRGWRSGARGALLRVGARWVVGAVHRSNRALLLMTDTPRRRTALAGAYELVLNLVQPYIRSAADTYVVLSVRLSTPGRHPKISSFDVAEGRL
jgi:hypothetical protein